VTRSAKVRAVVLRTVDYGERDRVVSLLSRERGKLSAFARGARASKRRFGGVLEPFHLLAAEVSERGGDLWGLENASVEQAFGAVRGDLARIACASYAVELASELVRDAEPHEDLFDALVAYLGRLDAAPARPWDLRAFELAALRAAGLAPSLDGCARCGETAGDGPARFDPSQGGVLCAACRPFALPGAVEASAPALQALRRLQAGEGVDAPSPVAVEARRIVGAHVEHHLGKRLASRRFLEEIAPVLLEPGNTGSV
jgi:DNA repair protein RecO (recombination protein O)